MDKCDKYKKKKNKETKVDENKTNINWHPSHIENGILIVNLGEMKIWTKIN